jgi:2-polyprenyl-6-methoxyphenol hydroxylase-like FAD-dependent oxidoreductase
MSKVIDTDVLVVGAGPAGASAGLFLAKYGIRTLVISRHRGTAETPRAHIVNQRTMEVMRDAGWEQACVALASPSSHIAHSFFPAQHGRRGTCKGLVLGKRSISQRRLRIGEPLRHVRSAANTARTHSRHRG